MKLPIHERFYTFQGEGLHAGRAAFFIRTFGCPVHCPWCDSAGTWHPDYIPEQIERFTAEALAEEVAATAAEFTVITGGEPAIHDLGPLCDALHAVGRQVHLETSGAFPIRGAVDWITLSPKRWKHPLAENVARADEFKLIVDRPEAIDEYSTLLQAAGASAGARASSPGTPEQSRRADSTTIDSPSALGRGQDAHAPVWLHPEWSRHNDPAILEAITDWIKAHGAPYRAGWQMHKHYAADLADPRSARAAPLGGNPKLGY